MNKTEQRYKEALERIEKFGHSNGHGHGYTCANIAEEALKNDKLTEDEIREALEMRINRYEIYNIRQ
jgi:hypothetical protein